jgi:2-iminobutanoate/2-iminopropanoate deaminase
MQQKGNMSAGAGVKLVWRRFSGPVADEIHVHCQPGGRKPGNPAQQTAALYQAVDLLLRREKGSLANVVQEVVFFRNVCRDFEQVRKARLQAFTAAAGGSVLMPAPTFVEQPPLDADADLLISACAIMPHSGPLQGRSHDSPAPARSYCLGNHRHLWAGSICSRPGAAFDQTVGMFRLANEILENEGMSFRDVVRTWIYLRRMERDYAEFNRGRREFFHQQRVALLPASTGIYGAPSLEDADFALSFHAVKAPRPLEAAAMTTPTLNEARSYGADFSRGLRVAEGNKIALYVSGTASVNEAGRTAHAGDFTGQAERMLLNVATLLSEQNASFGDVLAAVTYLKTPEDARTLHRILRDRGLEDIPNALVHAAVCRPDLLCEMEAIAALPLADAPAERS